MQSRLGPMEAGPYGSLQLLAEVGKWMQKEDLAPDAADERIYKIAPLVVLLSTFLLVVVVPFGPARVLHELRGRRLLSRSPLPRSACSASSSPDGRQRQQVLAPRRPARRRSAHRLRTPDGARHPRGRHPGRLDEPAAGSSTPRTPARSSAVGWNRQPVHPHPVRRLPDLHDRRAGRTHPERRSTCRSPSPNSSPAT